MPKQFIITSTISFLGTNYGLTRTVTGDNDASSEPAAGIAPAQQGSLTGRTDNDTGVVTMDSGGHTIVNGRVDVYWAGGSRYGMTATVAGTAVTVDGGTGDPLPALTTVMFVTIPDSESLVFTGNAAVGMLAYSQIAGADRPGWVVFTQANDTFIAAYPLTAAAPIAEWDQATNPFAGVTNGKVYFSHGNLSARLMGVVVLYS